MHRWLTSMERTLVNIEIQSVLNLSGLGRRPGIHGCWFTGLFVSCGDDWSAVQHDQYRRTVAYGKSKGDLEEWPKMPEDWNNKQHLYWDSAKAQKAGSGQSNPDFWAKYE